MSNSKPAVRVSTNKLTYARSSNTTASISCEQDPDWLTQNLYLEYRPLIGPEQSQLYSHWSIFKLHMFGRMR